MWTDGSRMHSPKLNRQRENPPGAERHRWELRYADPGPSQPPSCPSKRLLVVRTKERWMRKNALPVRMLTSTPSEGLATAASAARRARRARPRTEATPAKARLDLTDREGRFNSLVGGGCKVFVCAGPDRVSPRPGASTSSQWRARIGERAAAYKHRIHTCGSRRSRTFGAALQVTLIMCCVTGTAFAKPSSRFTHKTRVVQKYKSQVLLLYTYVRTEVQ
jgi:hypothetical protein